MQVVEEHEQRPRPGESFQQAADGPGDLLRPREQLIESDRSREARDDKARVLHVGEQGEQLRPRRLAAVLVLDSGERLQHDREREVGDALAVWDAPALEHGRAVTDDCRELLREARLARARLAEHRRHAARARLQRILERLDQLRQLERTADDRRLEPTRKPGRIRSDVHDAVRGDPPGLALQLERFELLDGERIPDEPVRRRADHDLPRLCALLEPGGDVHHVAGRERAPGGAVAGDDLARVHAGAGVEPQVVVADQLVVDDRERRARLDRRADCSERIVLVQDRQAEDGDESVARELLERAPVPGDDRRDLAEVA